MSETKDNGQALAPRVEALVPTTFDETMSMARVFAASGFFADSREAAQAVVKMLAGRELGLPPIASMTGIYIVKGRVGIGAGLMAAAIQRSGRFRYRVAKHTEHECAIEFYDGTLVLGTSAFSLEDAKKAGLTGNPTWQGYPRNMLFARAMSNGVKWYCPGIFGGPVYTPDELEEMPEPTAPQSPASAAGPGPDAPPAPTAVAEALGTEKRQETAGEKPPSYEPFGAVTMVAELGGGRFTGDMLENYFGKGVRTKTALEKLKGEDFDVFKAGYDRLRKDYKDGKAGATKAEPEPAGTLL